MTTGPAAEAPTSAEARLRTRIAATDEVLRAIAAQPADPRPVFALIARHVRMLAGATTASLLEYDGTLLHRRADEGWPDAVRAELEAGFPRPPGPDFVPGRVVLADAVVRIADIATEPGVFAPARRLGSRSYLGIPLRHEGRIAGVLTMAHGEVGAFDAEAVELAHSFAEQAVIAMQNARLIAEQRARTAELQEALGYQTATSEVLQLISRATFDLRPVLQTLAETMARLCDAEMGFILRQEGEEFRAAASVGFTEAFHAYMADHPLRAGRGSVTGRVALERRTIQVEDVAADPEYTLAASTALAGQRTALGVPLLRDGALLGVIVLARKRVEPFTARQVALVSTFADQAVIAIENTRLLTEQREALERQTATAEVLEVINASPGELAPVFGVILTKAIQLCGVDFGLLHVWDGTSMRAAASHGMPAAFADYLVRNPTRRELPPIVRRLMETRRTILIPDAKLGEGYVAGHAFPRALVDLGGARTTLQIPLVRDDTFLGYFSLYRQEVRPFSERHVSLLEGFAAQAVIAMENARLLGELRESLEYQSAISGLLRTVGSSLGDPAPVFDGILERAHALCGAEQGSLQLWDGERMRAVAVRGQPEDVVAVQRAGYAPNPQDRLDAVGQIADVREAIAAGQAGAVLRLVAERTGLRTLLRVPLLKDGRVLGRIVAGRREVRPFGAKHIALLQTFADQAVLAIENARLLEDLRARTAELAARNDAFAERIEHQAATIDVLQVMSASPGDPQPVFELIVERARAVCNVPSAALCVHEGGLIHLRAANGISRVTGEGGDFGPYRGLFPMVPSERSLLARSVLRGEIVHCRDVPGEPGLFPEVYAVGHGSSLSVPMLRDGRVIGTVTLSSRETGGFSDSQVALLRTFAEQAVIAITSAETYKALQERTAELAARNDAFSEQIAHQAATIDVLKVMSASTGDTQPVFDTILRRAMALCGCAYGNLHEYDGTLLHLRAHAGWSEAAVRNYAAAFPRPPDRSFTSGRTILEGRAIHFANVDEEPDLAQQVRDMGVKSVLAVPLLREGRPIGAIALGRIEPGGFSAAQVALLQTFAEQAVIAVASAETFGALQQRTEELARSVSELSALEEVGRAVNASLELDTVLATIIERSVRLSQADEGTIYEFDEAAGVFVPKAAQGMAEERVAALRARRVRLGETHLGRAAAEARVVQVADAGSDPTLSADARGILAGIHAVLAVPLLREGRVLGGLVVRRRRPGAFEPGAVSLLQTFAAQCVLAIENARLFEEARRARAAAEAALADLRRTQDRLVQTEKLASLGQLTAGIAHEIKNPLNFVNNFSDLSAELVEELAAAVAPGRLTMEAGLREEIEELTATLRGNLGKIAQHGRRADSIVRNMLLHSRAGEGEARPADLNALAAEALNLAYHGARAAQPDFAVALEQALDPAVGTVEVFPQEITRVLLNLVGNGFYAARRRAAEEPGHAPALRLATRDLGAEVEIRVRDNGAGIPEALRERIFQPFFTTKPAGEGTGLGLSLSHDIVVKQHGGRLELESRPGAFTEFVVTLPRRMARGGGP